MRTTVTLAPDADAHVRKLMRTRGFTFGQALNEAIRAGVGTRHDDPVEYTTPVDMGAPRIDLDKASHFTAQLEDDETIRKLTLRK